MVIKIVELKLFGLGGLITRYGEIYFCNKVILHV
jgi:hypothetical protein